MKILSIKTDKFSVGAVIHERTSGAQNCPLLDQFREVDAKQAASRSRLYAYFDMVATDGLSILNTAQSHQINATHGIYEFIAGRIRVLYFVGEPRNVVICSHMFVKKTQKTPQVELNTAVQVKKDYDKAQAKGLVEWKEKL